MIEKSVDIKAKARTQALEETMNALEQKVRNRTLELEKILAESVTLQQKLKAKETEITQLKKDINKVKTRKPKTKKYARIA